GVVYWNNAATPLNQLQSVMTQTVQRDPSNQPRLEIDVNGQAEYEVLARVLAYAKNADMQKIGFVQQDQ
ncbi:MAG TPA: biopolymer transporter ExbD, partial [Lysobacter sp.]|nr:biopolymer transporter ExbD [Lysobacter sp.]